MAVHRSARDPRTDRERPPRAVSPHGPAAHVRRALGRLPPPGADRHLRDLLEPRGDPGRRDVRAHRRRLDLPVLPRVRDRARTRHAGRDDPAVVARPPVRLVEPGRLERRVDRGADRDARSACGRAGVGEEAARRARGRDGVLRRRRDERGRVPRGRQSRRGDERAGGVRLQQQPVGDLDADRGADACRARSPTRRSATASRACASTGSTCSPSTRQRARRSSVRAPAAARR